MKDRIKKFIEAKGITAGELAAVLDVQRSNISHILNGRNKPGASFIERLLLEFPDLDARWLLTGEGNMLNDNDHTSKSPQQTIKLQEDKHNEHYTEETLIKKVRAIDKAGNEQLASAANEVEKMIIVYRDGTFKIYNQR